MSFVTTHPALMEVAAGDCRYSVPPWPPEIRRPPSDDRRDSRGCR